MATPYVKNKKEMFYIDKLTFSAISLYINEDIEEMGYSHNSCTYKKHLISIMETIEASFKDKMLPMLTPKQIGTVRAYIMRMHYTGY